MAIANAAVQLGIVVSRPMTDGRRYDLIFDTGARLLRVQCKWATLMGDVVRIHSRTFRLTTRGGVRGTYTAAEVDAIAGWCAALKRAYVVPIHEIDGQSMVHLRLAPARNNQRDGVRMADRYELGAVAQLEEHFAGSEGVRGSSPLSST